MYSFIIQKILNKKWLISCMLIGTILLIAIASCNPMYKDAALQKMLTDEFADYLEKNNEYPAVARVYGNVSTSRLNIYSSELFADPNTAADRLAEQFEHETIARITHLHTHSSSSTIEDKRENVGSFEASVGTLHDMEEHIDIFYGTLYSSQKSDDGVIECIINESLMLSKGLILNDIVVTPIRYSNGDPVRLKIVGVFKSNADGDPYWVKDPLTYTGEFFIDSALFDEIFMSTPMIASVACEYYAVFDYESIRTNEINSFIRSDNAVRGDCEGGLYSCEFNYESSFITYRSGSNQVNITMLIFQIPVMLLLISFIFMVSNQIISIEQGEIAMLKSRGVSKSQLIRSYLLQGTILSFIGLIIGIPLGFLFCLLFGATKSFLEFSVRTTIIARITPLSLLYGLIAAIAAIIIMTIPVLKYANFSIVEQKVNKKKSSRPMWQRVFLDLILLAVSLYGLYSFNHQKAQIISDLGNDSPLDPLLYFSSSIFIFAMALLLLRLLPLLSRLVFAIRSKKWKPAGYASFMQINKSIRGQSFIIVFLVLTLSLGIFNASTARTITGNEDKRVKYDNGAMVVAQETWASNKAAYDLGLADKIEYYEPSTDYSELKKNVSSMTKVVYDKNIGVMHNSEMLQDSTLFMAIDTYEFGNTAYMPEGETRFHWYYYLNALAKNPYGAIISRNLADKFSLAVGSEIKIYRRGADGRQSTLNLTVSAIVDAWPSYESKRLGLGSDGKEYYQDQYLVVMNYRSCYQTFGKEPYQYWLKLDSPDVFYDFAEKNSVSYSIFKDSITESEETKERPFYQITSGMLTLAFIVVLILSMIGFLIYWITSIRSRELMFGIYRAMGMSMSEIITMLICEHIFGSLIPILYGVLVGILAARLFVPLIELAYISTYTTLVSGIVVSPSDMIRLFICVLIMLIVCFICLGRILKNMKITQALKLGED